MKAKKKKNDKDDGKINIIPEGRKKKRAKREMLENWGETEVDSESDVRSRLLNSTVAPVTSTKLKQTDMEFKMVGLSRCPRRQCLKRLKWKQPPSQRIHGQMRLQ